MPTAIATSAVLTSSSRGHLGSPSADGLGTGGRFSAGATTLRVAVSRPARGPRVTNTSSGRAEPRSVVAKGERNRDRTLVGVTGVREHHEHVVRTLHGGKFGQIVDSFRWEPGDRGQNGVANKPGRFNGATRARPARSPRARDTHSIRRPLLAPPPVCVGRDHQREITRLQWAHHRYDKFIGVTIPPRWRPVWSGRSVPEITCDPLRVACEVSR